MKTLLLSLLLCAAALGCAKDDKKSDGGAAAATGPEKLQPKVITSTVCPTFNGKYVGALQTETVTIYLGTKLEDGLYRYSLSTDGPSEQYLVADGKVINAESDRGPMQLRVWCSGAVMEITTQVGPDAAETLRFTEVPEGQGRQVRVDAGNNTAILTKE